MERINRSHKSKDLNTHIKGKAQLVEEGAVNSPVENINWDVQQAEVHSDIPLSVDQGDGRPIILRTFEYRFPPGMLRQPTEDEILTEGYVKFLESQLYFVDELDLVQPPKVRISSKGFRIFATCQARKGSIIPGVSKPQTLTQIAHDTARNPN